MTYYERWSPGSVIAMRGIRHNLIWYALPMYVVQDSRDLLACYWPAGSRNIARKKPSGERLTPRDIQETLPKLVESAWLGTDVLMLIQPGAAHAVYVMWEAVAVHHRNHTLRRTELLRRRLLRWFVNLQEPVHRTSVSIDTWDHMLDIEISPDRSSWQWKDEEELEEAVAVGMYTPAQAQAIRAEGERVLDRLRENRSPFCDGWERWSPPSEWSIPRLPAGWGLEFS